MFRLPRRIGIGWKHVEHDCSLRLYLDHSLFTFGSAFSEYRLAHGIIAAVNLQLNVHPARIGFSRGEFATGLLQQAVLY